MTDYLPKPLDGALLMARVQSALGTKPAPVAAGAPAAVADDGDLSEILDIAIRAAG